tara:strand:+ start:3510 stop:4748 length:1239 start_codon:yes stop_codon:yes gene_type:complete
MVTLSVKAQTEEQRLDRAAFTIFSHDRYTEIAGTLLIGDKSIVDDIPTAMTDGLNEKYSRTMVSELSDPELRFVMLHENRHKIYKHMDVYDDIAAENPMLTNMALDFVINIEITDENKDGFATMPTGKYEGLYDEKYRGMTVMQVYDSLKSQGTGGNGGSGKPSTGTGQPQSWPGESSGFDEHDFEGAKGIDEATKESVGAEIDQALRQGAIAAGKLGTGGELGSIKDLLEPQIDWREVLREFVQQTCAGKDFGTWSKPNRRYIGAGIYMPSTLSEKVEELVIAADTSGSVYYYLDKFLSEMVGICNSVRPDKVRLLYWDTQVANDESYELEKIDDLAKTTKPRGGGGTRVSCVPAYMREQGIRPQAVIVFTDGYIDGKLDGWDCPVLWCVLDNKGFDTDTGRILHIDSTKI